MSSGEVDRLSNEYISFQQEARKKQKTAQDERHLLRLDWMFRLYYDSDMGPYIPGRAVKEMLKSAAGKYRKGAELGRSLVIPQHRVPLTYDGPRDQEGLWDAGFRYTALVGVSNGRTRITRCRPCFDEWSLTCEIAIDTEDLDLSMVQTIVKRSEKFGLGDGRTIGFGSFVSSLKELRVQAADVSLNGHKAVDKRELKSNEVVTARITS
jgi:hypothetical protein